MKLSHLFSRVSSVSPSRLATTLLTAALVLGLLLGTSPAQAQTVPTVEVDGNGNVLRILNLSVTEDQGGTTVYDVDFVNGPASSVYPNLEQDFPSNLEQDAVNALAQVNDALNGNTPVPPAASSAGTDQFFIPIEEDNGALLSIGSENFAGIWDGCQTGCIAGSTTMLLSTPFTY